MEPVLRVAVVSEHPDVLSALHGFDAVLVPPDAASVAQRAARADLVLIDARETAQADAGALHGLLDELSWLRRPIVVLTGDAEGVCLRYLEAGADSCFDGSVSPAELRARLRSVARRYTRSERIDPRDREYCFGDITVSLSRQEVHRNGELVPLTPTEFRLLAALLERPNRIVPHGKLTADLWGAGGIGSRRHLRVHIRHLREKLERDPGRPRLIVTQKGRGYELRAS